MPAKMIGRPVVTSKVQHHLWRRGLGQHRSVELEHGLEHACLFNGIVARQAVADKKRQVRVCNASDLGQRAFVHEVRFVLHSSSGVDQHDVDVLRLR